MLSVKSRHVTANSKHYVRYAYIYIYILYIICILYYIHTLQLYDTWYMHCIWHKLLNTYMCNIPRRIEFHFASACLKEMDQEPFWSNQHNLGPWNFSEVSLKSTFDLNGINTFKTKRPKSRFLLALLWHEGKTEQLCRRKCATGITNWQFH